MESNVVKFKKAPRDFEITDDVEDLIRSAGECLQYTKEDGVGYHYYFMWLKLKELSRMPEIQAKAENAILRQKVKRLNRELEKYKAQPQQKD